MDDLTVPRRIQRRWLALLALPGLAVLLWLGSAEGVLGLSHSVGYAICHQIRVRTYVFGDLTMPLCARCTGQYLGFLVGVATVAYWGKLRTMRWPTRPISLLLLAFLAVWLVDGANSYLYLLLGRPLLYTPNNALRLITGLMQGIVVCLFFLPVFNQVFWCEEDDRPIVGRWRELAPAAALGGLVFVAVTSQWLPLFYPLAVLSAAGAFLLLSLVGAIFAVLLMRQERTATAWRHLLAWLAPGMLFALLVLGGGGGLRDWLETDLGLTIGQR